MSVRDNPLVAQCVVWCAMKGLKPTPVGSDMDEVMMLLAIIECRTPFKELNEKQRQRVAGVAG